MAILTLTVDTTENTMSLMVDGTPIDNPSEVNVYNMSYSEEEPQFYFSVTTHEKVGGVNKMTRLCASDDPAAKVAVASGVAKPSSTFAGFVEIPTQTKAQEQIAEWFKSTRGR